MRDVTAPIIKQLPLSFGQADKTDVRTQFAALCYRVKNDKIQILLITSRGSGRWILPKGWPMDGKTPAESAAEEAWEEAGVHGSPDSRPLGLFSYSKVLDDEDSGLPCVAMVYGIKVKSLSKEYPEAGQRTRKWVSRKKAAAMVDEPELSRILRDFDPRAIY
ncbi:NUDIX hydrolase [Tateyamaria armeniaca]|uniref:NUDIX hydrolase n=1 Tax=Tateyamaria armeniaca TaxID=2518930 RepID=A0ABW8UX70_9RHOB